MNRNEQRIQDQLAIPIHLLEPNPSARPWSNLGDWSHTKAYSTACYALASRIGHAAELGTGDSVLDIACGHGASLSVWPGAFGVAVVDAIERQTRAVASIESDRPAALRHVWQADMNLILSRSMPWPTEQLYDALVVVDAAYHFQSLPSFLKEAGSRLRSGGRLAFTTLILDSKWERAEDWQKRLTLNLAAAALIPAESLIAEKRLAESFRAAGFHSYHCEGLDHEVLEGFADYVRRRRKELNWRERGSAGWWKVEATAAAARQLLRTGLMHYVLLKAVKS